MGVSCGYRNRTTVDGHVDTGLAVVGVDFLAHLYSLSKECPLREHHPVISVQNRAALGGYWPINLRPAVLVKIEKSVFVPFAPVKIAAGDHELIIGS